MTVTDDPTAARAERVRLLKTMGDSALFVSGFFQDSLEGRLVDADYYRALGGSAYARLSREHDPLSGFGSEVYSELAARFGEFADLLAEIATTVPLYRMTHNDLATSLDLLYGVIGPPPRLGDDADR